MASHSKLAPSQVFGLLWLFIIWLVCLYSFTEWKLITLEGIGYIFIMFGLYTTPLFLLSTIFIKPSRCFGAGGFFGFLTLGVFSFAVGAAAIEKVSNLSNGWVLLFMLVVLWVGCALSWVGCALSMLFSAIFTKETPNKSL